MLFSITETKIGFENLNNDNPEENYEVIAAIIAVIASDLNTTTDKLIVRSFRRVSLWSQRAKG